MKEIYYYKSPVGLLKLVCSEKHLEEVKFTENAQKNPEKKSALLNICIEQFDSYFKGILKKFTIPLKFKKGTNFQIEVWDALQKIPYGETKSYKWIAEEIKNPKAIRAVGGANHNNPIPIVVPCHRVIGNNGKLVGYAGGLDKKKWLLKHEKENTK